MSKSSGPSHLAVDRKESSVGMLLRAEIAQSGMRLVSDAFQQRRRKPRFANTSLAGEQHYLAFTTLCLVPASQQEFEFFVPPNKLGQSVRVQGLEAAFD